MNRARRLIIAGAQSHPLAFLLRADGNWHGRVLGAHVYGVQAGHSISYFARMAQRFLLEDADYNQMCSVAERRHHVLFKNGIEIGGVPVELESARFWRDRGEIGSEVFERAPWTVGW